MVVPVVRIPHASGAGRLLSGKTVKQDSGHSSEDNRNCDPAEPGHPVLFLGAAVLVFASASTETRIISSCLSRYHEIPPVEFSIVPYS